MGQLKQEVIDTPQEDQTTASEPVVYPGQVEDSEPPVEVVAMVDLRSATNLLLQKAPMLTVGDIEDLTSIINDLQGLIKHVKKPF